MLHVCSTMIFQISFAGLDPVLFLHAEGVAEEVEGPDHFGVVGLLAGGAAGRIPLGEGHAHVAFGGVDGQRVAGEQEEHFRAVVGPGDHLVLAAVVAREREIALQLLDVEVDADLLPLLLDHLADLRIRNELTADRDHFEAQASLAVGAQPIPFGILLGQADLVEQLVGLLQIQDTPLLVPLGARAVDGFGRGRHRSGACPRRARTPR